jgi:hypothetical protein
MSVQLNPAAERCIELMHLREADQQPMREIISRYSIPKSFCQSLSWIVYRICNAIASIWGKSDWQNAKEMICRSLLVSAVINGMVSAEGLDSNMRYAERIINLFRELFSDDQDLVLNIALTLNSQDRTIAPPYLIPNSNLWEMYAPAMESTLNRLREEML